MKRIDLQGIWNLRQAGRDNTVSANVPGDNYSALLAANRIPDPYYGRNELDVQWPGESDWEYSRDFEVAETLLQCASVYLNAEILDTFAEIRINGKKAGTARNMFNRRRFEVKELLVPGINHISILFKSPVKEAAREAAKQPFPVPCCGNNTVPHLNLIRKVQCHAGWDWGISLLVSGIYGDISLNGVNEARIEHIYTEQAHGKGKCTVIACAEINAVRKQKIEVEFAFNGKSRKVRQLVNAGTKLIKTKFEVNDPELWWPAGYGGQALYELKVKTADENLSRQIGLRTIEVVRDKDERGTGMKFRVNGVDIFCKGANWIPVDAMPERHTGAVYRDLLESAAAANMNMLRVWGGGQYEQERFYELCDELGLLVWQDMMFACALYPSTADFLENVKEEFQYQIKRLKSHACLAIWCGDNECIGALNWNSKSRDNPQKYLINYDRLNCEQEKTVNEYGPEYTFWPSSPCGGPGDFSDNWHNDSCGDMHYWSVWHDGEPFESYFKVIPRFCSEFGFQSFPSREVFDTFGTAKDMNVFSPVMEHHQKNSSGNANIIRTISQYFRMPDGFDNFLYLSQVQQALAIKTGVEFWRHLRPVCMGTLYWQLNDNWPVASWSSLEYGGKWKQLHYHARRFYAPVASMVFQQNNELEIWSVNDLPEAQDISVRAVVYDFAGKGLQSWAFEIRLKAGSSKKLQTVKLENVNFEPNKAFMTIETVTADKTHINTHFFTPCKACELPGTEVKTKVYEEKGEFKLELRCDKPAFFVTLETPGIKGIFADNSITLLPGQKTVLTFLPSQKVSLDELKKSLTVKHLRQSYI
ncbi:MAG: hypothetical protein PHV82_11305 [Victivallaceae bacterium]|nr:hypothetical protein [Victivallaceae bacterium]